MEIGFFALMIVIGILLSIVGIIGCFVTGLPGPPLNYLALILLHFTDIHIYSTWVLVGLGILAAVILVVDFVVPVYFTKRTGGSNYGIWGCVIGLIIGLFVFPPFGIIFGPFIGAVVGELISGKEGAQAFKAGLGAFVGFITGTLSKLVVSILLIAFFIYGAIQGGLAL